MAVVSRPRGEKNALVSNRRRAKDLDPALVLVQEIDYPSLRWSVPILVSAALLLVSGVVSAVFGGAIQPLSLAVGSVASYGFSVAAAMTIASLIAFTMRRVWGARIAKKIQKDDGTGFRPSVHASIIKGGEEASSYPDCCTITLERRTLKGETPESVKEEIQELLRGIALEDPSFKYDVRTTFDRSSYELSLDHPFKALVEQTVESVVGRKPAVIRENYWTDCALIGEVGIPVLLFGPHGEGLHSMEEFANIDSLKQTTEILTKIANEFCK